MAAARSPSDVAGGKESLMSLEDDSRSLIETIDGALRGSFGVDPDRDHDEVCALATTGYVVSCWRNTVLEDIHSGGFVPSARRGSYARDGIRDRDMARLNVATWRQIRPHVHPTGIDVMAVRDLLRDKKRPVTIGTNTFTCGNLFAGTWTKLVWHLNEGAWLPLDLAGRLFGGDESAAMRYYAICGGNYAPDWFGNPWWEAAVTAWAKQNQPARVEDLDLALHTPNELDDNTIPWLMRAKYDRVFSDAIRTWKLDRGGNQTDPAGDLWFPPGVPELPKHLR
jgi:hypothetical protein